MTRVLIVDDEVSIRRTLQAFLLEAGYEVALAEDAACARRLLTSTDIDVVVSDIILPGVTGVELLQFIREAAPRVQVILMTGEPTVETAAEAVRAGALDYLSKPIGKQAVLRSVEHAARVKTLDDERERLALIDREYRRDLQQLVDQQTTELRETNERLRRTIEGTIHAMTLVVESRDPYTAGHQQHVASLARAIAQELALPEDRTEGLYLAGMIHDLGKIGVPAEILSKPGRLTDPEMSLIRTHPEVGFTILRGIQFPWPIAEIVRQHHERLDGSGYPRGLKGEDILLDARIIAVADVTEAMASHRPYRPALGIDRAIEEIERRKGTLYEPQAVDACVRLFSTARFAFDREDV